MDNQINEVVTTLADKIGLAAEKIQPIGEQMVKEVCLANTFACYIVAGIVFFTFTIILAIFLCCWRHARSLDSHTESLVDDITQEQIEQLRLGADNWRLGSLWVCGIASGLTTIVGAINFVGYKLASLQPTVELVEKFLK